jgi:putative acyl-CoA dehydrogenase
MNDRFVTHDVFNQAPPFENVNLFTTDRPLVEAVSREGGSNAATELEAFGGICGSAEALQQGRLANEWPPQLKRFDAKGYPLDKVDYHPAYHALMAISTRQGLQCSAWDHVASSTSQRVQGANVARSAGTYMAIQMEAGHQCPITMTNAAVPTLLLEPSLAKAWIPKIFSRAYDPSLKPLTDKHSVTIGMGMTEKQGGTDVRANTTTATPLGRAGSGEAYRITGHKWFMSAPMCDAFLVLAQAPNGLSCFLLPRCLPDGTLNTVRFQRLKDKLGNRSNASAEVEFHAAHAWMIGEEGRGVAAIIEMVTCTRLDCAVGSAGLMRLALANAVHHCRHRAVFHKMLIDQPMMAQVLADLALDVAAATALTLRLARSFDQMEDARAAAWRRLMTPVTKYWVCKIGPGLAYEAMECLGGNGYVEEGMAARIYRELPVNAIWEGSGNVMALDLLRVIEREPKTIEAVVAELGATVGRDALLKVQLDRVTSLLSERELLACRGRDLAEALALLATGTILRATAPHAVADAFLATRLGAINRQTYGQGLSKGDPRAIIDWCCPSH